MTGSAHIHVPEDLVSRNDLSALKVQMHPKSHLATFHFHGV